MFLGIVFLVSIVAGHQIFMHYEYLKNSLLVDYVYKIEDGKVKALTDPAKNTKNLELQVRKLSEEWTKRHWGTWSIPVLLLDFMCVGSERKEVASKSQIL